jgi:hypothetical protein
MPYIALVHQFIKTIQLLPGILESMYSSSFAGIPSQRVELSLVCGSLPYIMHKSQPERTGNAKKKKDWMYRISDHPSGATVLP